MKPSVIGVVVGLVLGYLVGYNNVYVRQQGQARLKERSIAQEQADQDARQRVTGLLDQIERYRQQLPPESDPSWVVHQAVAAGRQAGVTLTSIAQDVPQSGKSFTRLAATCQFSATYHQLGAFLDQLERSPNFIRVERLAVNTPRSGQMALPTVDVTLSTLYVPPSTQVLSASASSSTTASKTAAERL